MAPASITGDGPTLVLNSGTGRYPLRASSIPARTASTPGRSTTAAVRARALSNHERSIGVAAEGTPEVAGAPEPTAVDVTTADDPARGTAGPEDIDAGDPQNSAGFAQRDHGFSSGAQTPKQSSFVMFPHT
jgi:hypothetical protein